MKYHLASWRVPVTVRLSTVAIPFPWNTED
jgi:hypothetical protein